MACASVRRAPLALVEGFCRSWPAIGSGKEDTKAIRVASVTEMRKWLLKRLSEHVITPRIRVRPGTRAPDRIGAVGPGSLTYAGIGRRIPGSWFRAAPRFDSRSR
jgi:hypothetical protein